MTVSHFISRINSIFAPLEQQIQKYQKYIGYFFIGLSFVSLGMIFFPSTVKFSGEQSMNVLWFLLFLPIFARVIGLSLAQTLMPLRKEIGILMGTLAFVHGAAYILPSPTMLTESFFYWDSNFFSYTFLGLIALILTIPLLLTSNTWAIQKLGKYWKMLHRLVYGVIIFTVAHVVVLKMAQHFEFGQVLLLLGYFLAKIFEWKGYSLKEKKEYALGQKWLCVPCGYVYDPMIGDEDSGIAPGTEFSDLPSDWSCPICGVSKVDFVPYDESALEITHEAEIIEKTYLNPTTLELVVEAREEMKSKIGQFMSFLWNDATGDFIRSYSIVEQNGKKFTFAIKLTELGRGAKVLRNINVNAKIRLKGIFGNFLLLDTKNPKIFIATGTGLAPIYNMITSLAPEMKKVLYFTVAYGNELFYLEKLRTIPNLELHVHTTKETVDGCEHGRVNVDTISTSENTEWYLCGNPKMVAEAREKLAQRGFAQVYSEEF